MRRSKSAVAVYFFPFNQRDKLKILQNMELVLPQFTVAVLVFFGQVYSAPVPKKIHSDRLYACKDLVSNESIIDPTALCRIDVQFEGFVQIGEHVVIRGGKFGPSFSVRELSMLGKHIVAGRSVKLSRRVCIEDDTILDHGLKVHKGGMAKMLGEKLVITYPPAGSRYILRDGKCLGYKV